jgi:chromosomal replication initiator protein
MSRIWENALQTLAGRINPNYYDLWIRPIECTQVTADHITLRAPNLYFKEWFSAHYLPVVLDEIQHQTQRRFQVTFEIALPPTGPRVPPDTAAVAPDAATMSAGLALPAPVTSTTGGPAPATGSVDLIDSFTFDSFVVGPANQLAHAAARAASKHPAEKFNPIYIYGGVGLGKTHLLMAIAHELRRMNPGWNIVYLSCERYINEYITALRTSDSGGESRIDQFRRRYRDDCDALLIDDIQFLAGKERTQDEFFHTFNSLWHAHKQIVLTSDKFPYEIDNLEERLRSRFGWGLVADIQRPDLEMRVAILTRKAELDGIALPPEVALHLAQNIRSNVRDLEGALIRLAASASLQQLPLSVELCRTTLTEVLDPSVRCVTMETIVREVADHFHQKITDLRGPRRHQSIAWPRQVAMYLSYRLLQSQTPRISYPQVASYFGGRDHTTVLSACRKLDHLRETDHSVASLLSSLEQRLQR